MSIFEYSQIYLTKAYKEFGGIQKSPRNALFIIVGMPYDSTTTFRPGTRFAPSAIREASINIETNSLLSTTFLEDVEFYDVGDLDLIGLDIREALRRITSISQEAVSMKKILLSIGGEHTITYGILKGMKFDTLFIFDAHLDLRDEYPAGVKYGHATVIRRIYEEFRPAKLFIIGARAFSKEERKFAENNNINILDIRYIKENFNECIKKIKGATENSSRIYISIDMDVFDPTYAPAVSNPEPFGLSLSEFLNLIKSMLSRKVVGVDLVEVSPLYDNGNTAILASKILLECMATIWSSQP
jgi:agmatinase